MSVNIEDFKKLEIKIGKIIAAEKVEGAGKLLKLQVDFGSAKQNSNEQELSLEDQEKPTKMIRQIVSGIAEYYSPEFLIGKEFPFIINLEPRIIRGTKSQRMILAVDVEGEPILINPDKEVPPGSIVR